MPSLRWAAKRILGIFPEKKVQPITNAAPQSVLYLFAGTFGDYIQILPALKALSDKYPASAIYLYSCDLEMSKVDVLLPVTVIPIQFRNILTKRPGFFDFVYSNSIAAYRVRLAWISYIYGKISMGYCYRDDVGRNSNHLSMRLIGSIRNYAALNRHLVQRYPESGMPRVIRPPSQYCEVPGYEEPFKLKSSVLFHCGSTTLLSEFGSARYGELIKKILFIISKAACHIEVVYGPKEKHLIKSLTNSGLQFKQSSYNLTDLKEKLDVYEGTILCFDSFMAHFCRYLNKRALVFYRELCKTGYDNTPFHYPVILRSEDNWSLHSFEALIESMN